MTALNILFHDCLIILVDGSKALIYSENIYTQTAVFCNVVLVLSKDGYIHETQKLQTSDGSYQSQISM